jgi:hypothetical protein
MRQKTRRLPSQKTTAETCPSSNSFEKQRTLLWHADCWSLFDAAPSRTKGEQHAILWPVPELQSAREPFNRQRHPGSEGTSLAASVRELGHVDR